MFQNYVSGNQKPSIPNFIYHVAKFHTVCEKIQTVILVLHVYILLHKKMQRYLAQTSRA
jgi:energy-converting hydrogenase Eha subunit C